MPISDVMSTKQETPPDPLETAVAFIEVSLHIRQLRQKIDSLHHKISSLSYGDDRDDCDIPRAEWRQTEAKRDEYRSEHESLQKKELGEIKEAERLMKSMELWSVKHAILQAALNHLICPVPSES